MSDPMTGSCKCNSVKYQLNSPIKMAGNCHCNLCKKLTGGAFASVAFVDEAGFEILQGSKVLTSYQVSENAEKHFCSTCGSPVFNRHKGFPGSVMIPIGTLDHPERITPGVNVYCENMLPWVPTIMELASFEQAPEK